MLALASGLIAGDLDLIAVARKLNVFCDGVEPEIDALLSVFRRNPLGDRCAANRGRASALERWLGRTEKLARAEERWRHEAVGTAMQLIRLLEQNS